MKRKRVLICGASGFIGFNLFQALSKRNDLDVIGTYLSNRYNRIDPKNAKLVRVDLTDKEQVDELTKGMDIIIQAAANTSGAKDVIERPFVHVVDTVVMNTYLFKSAHINSVPHVVFLSCTVAYPNTNKPLRETDMDLNADFGKYTGAGWMKIFSEKQCDFYSRLGRTGFTVIRHSNIYGPYDRFDLERSHVFGATITKVMTAQDGKITVWGEGKEVRDFLYITDLNDFIERVINNHDYPFDIFNVGLGRAITIRSLVNRVVKLSGRKLEVIYDKTGPTIGTKIMLNVDKARRKFNWRPKIGLNEGIRRTIDWHKMNFHKFY